MQWQQHIQEDFCKPGVVRSGQKLGKWLINFQTTERIQRVIYQEDNSKNGRSISDPPHCFPGNILILKHNPASSQPPKYILVSSCYRKTTPPPVHKPPQTTTLETRRKNRKRWTEHVLRNRVWTVFLMLFINIIHHKITYQLFTEESFLNVKN